MEQTNEPQPVPEQTAAAPQQTQQPLRGYRKIIGWIRKHKISSFFLALLVIFILQLALLPYGEIDRLKTKNPGETAFMREQAERAKDLGKPFHKVQYWIPLRTIPKDAVDAVILAEDGTFWWNEGFDWYEFKESIEKNWEEGRIARGASTITQQLAKNLFLSSSKNPFRKLKEWVLTWYMDRELSKNRIMEIYLNVIEWGNGIYGIEAASRVYFGKGASGLTREECARLAAIIPSPRSHRANTDSKYVLRRSQIILERMSARGL
jgi:monofunctional biosynthetic peptidoglycan transglycosylase